MTNVTFVTAFEGAWFALLDNRSTGWMLFSHGGTGRWVAARSYDDDVRTRYFATKSEAQNYIRARIAHPAGLLG